MATVRVMVLRGPGINCDEETMAGWSLAGGEPELVHINRLTAEPSLLRNYQIVTIPGGFSYGDDIAAGTVFASIIRDRLLDPLRDFIARGGGMMGICNGFQILVKTGLLPGHGVSDAKVTVTFNESARFEARWVRLKVTTDRCPYLRAGTCLELPIEHAEGRVITADDGTLSHLEDGGFVAVRYVDESGQPTVDYPANPNGSVAGIAGLCDVAGTVFGMMPHPDRHLDHTNHPLWTRRTAGTAGTADGPPDGLSVFQNAVAHWR